jgi:hypothetical protein
LSAKNTLFCFDAMTGSLHASWSAKFSPTSSMWETAIASKPLNAVEPVVLEVRFA